MKKQIIYEWVIEQIDSEGDIIDCDYYESFSEIPKNNIGNTIGLCKTTYHPVAGVLNRTYAYVKNNTSPTTFDNGDRIPNDLAIEFIKIENNQNNNAMKNNTHKITTKYRNGLGDFLDAKEYQGITWEADPLLDDHIVITVPHSDNIAHVCFNLAMAFTELDRITIDRINHINQSR